MKTNASCHDPRGIAVVTIACLLCLVLVVPSSWAKIGRYACEDDHLEIMFEQATKVRLRNGEPVDLAATKGLVGVANVLDAVDWHEWHPFSPVSEAFLDRMHAENSAKAGYDLYNLNNIYRLRIAKGHDIWAIAEALEALPGVMQARPVPLPMPLPTPPDYEPQQGYLRPAGNTPTGIDADYAWTQPGGDGTGVTVCDMEYSWNYNHADITKAVGSQINYNVADPFSDNNHGTAVIGVLVADDNGWGTTGICHGANLLTCGTYFGSPPSWNVPGAITLACSTLVAGDVLLIEQQWDYTGSGGYIPIEWWTNSSPSWQSQNAVYNALVHAYFYDINVVEAGGNGNVDCDLLNWFGDTQAIVVGAGGVYTGGTYPEGDLERLSFSSYGWRFNLQGWGENVVTTAYNDLYSAEGPNYYYTAVFDGTSSASPCVAGAVACCSGYWQACINPTPPGVPYLRQNLNLTGTHQVFPPNGAIGQRPDLQAMFAFMTPPCSCPFQSDFDQDGFLTSLDLSGLIDILFAGDPDVQDPQCPSPRADLDCDGYSTSLDLSRLIDHLFASGPGPCDPCNP
jgi:serine protease